MADYKDTGLWKRTLAPRNEDPNAAAREKLRQGYEKMRERAAMLVAEVSRILPDYTVHDISHLDALWEMADLIAGPTYSLNPAEAFVLGGAILIHDAGMSLAAYPRGLDDLKTHRLWADTVTYYSTIGKDKTAGGPATKESTDELLRDVVPDMLRRLHAEQAEHLMSIEWSDKGGRKYRLLEDEDLCQLFGTPIGQIAHSHWWSIEEVEQALANRTIGAPTFCPADWIIDLLKIACLLRVSDAAHLDARRAPGFLRALRHPSYQSKLHWIFQERLTKPTCRGDTLHYTSAESFQSSDAEAWWLCFEILGMVDAELRHTDALLADKRSELLRFTARRVANVEDPDRLVQDIPVAGWRPVDTRIHISDVTGLISKLGGAELYGNNPVVALRELIQNAADAVRARRRLEGRSSDWGTITVRLINSDNSNWLEVEDNGIGMSDQVIRQYLLNFGSSYWGSELMRTEFPGLLAQGIKQTGRYGIGFFSLSIISDHVLILTRRFNAGYDKTYSLEFASGLWSRPILRTEPMAGSQLRDGGTRVRVRLRAPASEIKGLLFRDQHGEPLTLATVGGRTAPALDVNLLTVEPDGRQAQYAANEWLTLSGPELCRKLHNWDEDRDFDDEIEDHSDRFAKNIKPILSGDQVLGRAFIVPAATERYGSFGCVTVGGLTATGLRKVCGIIQGTSIRASRDVAIPICDIAAIAQWATEQAELLFAAKLSPPEQADAAATVHMLRGSTRNLKIALSGSGWLNAEEVAEWSCHKTTVLVDSIFTYERWKQARPNIKLHEDVLCVNTAGGPILNYFLGSHFRPDVSDWPWLDENDGYHSMSLTGLLVKILASSWNEEPKTLESQIDWRPRSDPRITAEFGRDGSFPVMEKMYRLKRTSSS